MKEYKYKAFISYRHLEPDMQAAEKLQKLLEGYKPPKNITEKKETWRIFRDVSELQSSSDLSEDIRNAIEDSEFLIIICSPAYNESKWCRQELMHFRELHGNTNDNIITLLVDGEPDKAFPELLRFTDMKSVDENGSETTVKVEIEPLAANIKADTLKDSMKKLNTEYLRIAAPLIGCDFDDLYQREKKREAQRRMRLLGSAFAVLAVITVISAASAITIKKKNNEIEDKNGKIEEQFNKIEEQYGEIEKQYSALVVENAEHLAAESEVLYNNNSLIPAIRKAVQALPSKEGEKPAIPEAQFALSKEMGVFRSENICPRYALKHDFSIEKLSFMGGGKSIVSQDSSGIYFWNAEDGSLIKKITPDDAEFAAPEGIEQNYLNAVIEPDTDKTGTAIKQFASSLIRSESTIFDYITDSHAHSVTDEEPGTGGDVFVSNAAGTVWRLAGADGKTIWKNDAVTDGISFKKLIYDGKYLLRMYTKQTDTVKARIMLDVIDTDDGKTKYSIDVTDAGGNSFTFDSSTEVLAFRDNILYTFKSYLAGSETNMMIAYEINNGKPEKKWGYTVPDETASNIYHPSLSFFGGEPVAIIRNSSVNNAVTKVIRFDKENGEPVWSTDIQSGSASDGKVFLYEAKELGSSQDVIVIVGEKSYSLVGYNDGKIIDTVILDNKINSVSFSRSGFFMYTVQNGEEYAINLKPYFSKEPQRIALRIQKFGEPFALCSYSRGKYVTAADYANTAYIQFSENNADYTGIAPEQDSLCKAAYAVSSDGSRTLAAFGKKDSNNAELFICDTAAGKYTKVGDIDAFDLLWAHFLTDDKLAAALKDADNAGCKLCFIDLESGKVSEIKDADRSDVNYTVMGDSIFFFDTSSGCVLKKLSPDGTVTSVKFEDGKDYIQGMYSAAGDRAAVLTSKGTDSQLEFYSFDSGNCVAADHSFDQSEASKILRIFSINDKTVGVLMKNKIVLVFDAETGKLVSEIKLDGIHQEVAAAAGIGNDRFIVLSRDTKLYEADMYGLTGKVIDLNSSVRNSDAVNGKNSSEQSDSLSALQAADSGYFYAVWNGDTAFYIDRDSFKIRYVIEDFAFAPSGKDIVFTHDENFGHFGYFPIYTAQQLVDRAGSYLSALGEAENNK